MYAQYKLDQWPQPFTNLNLRSIDNTIEEYVKYFRGSKLLKRFSRIDKLLE